MTISKLEALELLRQNQLSFIEALNVLAPNYNNPGVERGGVAGFFDASQGLRIRPLRELAQSVQAEGSPWDNRMRDLSKLVAEFQKLYAEFLRWGGLYVDNSQENYQPYQIITRQIYTAMDITRVCFSRMITELDKPQRSRQSTFAGRYQELATLQNIMRAYPQQFLGHVNHITSQIQDRQIQNPGSHQQLSLHEVIIGLNRRYNEDYDNTYGHGFWRWIKNLFKKDHRSQQIQFLADVSNAEGCTDLVRKEAMMLVNNAIMNTELFGSGSRLGGLLRSFCQATTLTTQHPEHLTVFLERHSNNIDIPESLSGYYQHNQGIFSGQAEPSIISPR